MKISDPNLNWGPTVQAKLHDLFTKYGSKTSLEELKKGAQLVNDSVGSPDTFADVEYQIFSRGISACIVLEDHAFEGLLKQLEWPIQAAQAIYPKIDAPLKTVATRGANEVFTKEEVLTMIKDAFKKVWEDRGL